MERESITIAPCPYALYKYQILRYMQKKRVQKYEGGMGIYSSIAWQSLVLFSLVLEACQISWHIIGQRT